MKKIIFSFASVLILSAMISSCKKAEVDTETQSAVDNATCEGEFMAIGPNTNNKAITKGGQQGFKVMSPIILDIDSTVKPGGSTYPRKLTVDYGAGVTDPVDGKTRAGKIFMWIDTNWVAPVNGFVKHATIKFLDYSVNGVIYNADSIYITRPSANVMNFRVVNGACWNNVWHIDWSCNRTITTTMDGSGNVTAVSLYGTANGKNRDGKSFSVDISANSPFVKVTDCKWPQSGIVDITPEGKATRSVDYSEGGGSCDNKASLTIKGNKFVFSMD